MVETSRPQHPITSWRTRTVIRILLVVASMVADDETAKREIATIANHIACGKEWF